MERAKQLRARCQQLEEQVADAGRVRDELARVQQQLGALHGTHSALKGQLRAAREQREQVAAAREQLLSAQVGGRAGNLLRRRGWEQLQLLSASCMLFLHAAVARPVAVAASRRPRCRCRLPSWSGRCGSGMPRWRP